MRGLMLVSIVFAGEALAHPQHRGGAWSAPLAHLLGEPDHLALLLLPVIVGLGLWRARRTRGVTRPERRRTAPARRASRG